MNNPLNIDDPNEPLDEPLNEASESALDAFLHESVGNQSPPDLMNLILDRLHAPSKGHQPVDRSQLNDESGSITPHANPTIELATRKTSRRDRSRVSLRKNSKSWLLPAVVSAGIAVSLMGVFWISGRSSHSPTVAIDSLSTKEHPSAQAGNATTSSEFAEHARSDNGANHRKLQQPMRPSILLPPKSEHSIAVDDEATSTSPMISSPDSRSDNLVERLPPKDLPGVRLVSASIGERVQRYWESVDVVPTQRASTEEVVARLSMTLGTEVPADVINDCESLLGWLRKPDVARSIARRWWNHVTSGRYADLDEEEQELLLEPVAESIRGSSRRIDRVIASWLSQPSPSSDAFLGAMTQTNRMRNAPMHLASLGALTMSADLRCIQCHDSHIEGCSTQHDYWSFAAILASGTKKTGGRLRLAPHRSPSKSVSPGVFFELPDRRQQLAEPSIAKHWADGNTRMASAQSLPEFADSLIGSQVLARGIVNSMWRMVHGTPLHTRVVDPLSPPTSDSLIALEDRLSNELRASHFDLGRTLSLILHSPTTRRSVPKSLRDVWARDRSQAHQAVVAFAGATPKTESLPLHRRVDQVLRSIGGKFPASGKELLAQVHPSGQQSSRKRPASENGFSWDFPDQADEFPVAWLSILDHQEDQIKHLCYLAGHNLVPKFVEESAIAMQNANVEERTMLHRIGWLLQE